MFIKDALSIARQKFAVFFMPGRNDIFNLLFSTLDPCLDLTEEEVERLKEFIESAKREQENQDVSNE